MSKKEKHYNIWLNKSAEEWEWKLRLLKETAGALLVLFSLFAWGYVLAVRNDETYRFLIAAAVANGIVLAGNLILYVGLYGYRDGFKKHVMITSLAAWFLTFLAFYIFGAGAASGEKGELAETFSVVLRFFINLLIALIMAVVPSALDCGIMWLIAHVFGKEDKG